MMTHMYASPGYQIAFINLFCVTFNTVGNTVTYLL